MESRFRDLYCNCLWRNTFNRNIQTLGSIRALLCQIGSTPPPWAFKIPQLRNNKHLDIFNLSECIAHMYNHICDMRIPKTFTMTDSLLVAVERIIVKLSKN